jgi:hypothetical protein
LRFGVCFSTAITGACPNENFVSRDLAISDYSDRLLVLLNQKKARRVAINKPLILCAIRISGEGD